MSTLLSPKPGFCVKSSTLTPGLLPPAPSDPKILEPTTPIPIPKGTKVFINIAWDPNVPAPPPGSEDAIQRAMEGQDDMDETNPDGWYVPVIVSPPRRDVDKAGKPSLVVDCIYNSTVKSRTLRDSAFKLFLVELALQRIEAQTKLLLSREIGTPNIASKGKLLPRTVHIPPALLAASSGNGSASAAASTSSSGIADVHTIPSIANLNTSSEDTILKPKKPLIQELPDPASVPLTPKKPASSSATSLPGLRGILKSSGLNASSPAVSTSVPKSESQPPSSASVTQSTSTPIRSSSKTLTTSDADPDDKGRGGTQLTWSWFKLSDIVSESGSVNGSGPSKPPSNDNANGSSISTLPSNEENKERVLERRLKAGLSTKIVVRVPGLKTPHIPHCTLDIEPRRVIFTAPSLPSSSSPSVLDINLDLSDAEITYLVGTRWGSAVGHPPHEQQQGKQEETTRTLLLKRQPDFNVERAEAEWRVEGSGGGEGVLMVWV